MWPKGLLNPCKPQTEVKAFGFLIFSSEVWLSDAYANGNLPAITRKKERIKKILTLFPNG